MPCCLLILGGERALSQAALMQMEKQIKAAEGLWNAANDITGGSAGTKLLQKARTSVEEARARWLDKGSGSGGGGGGGGGRVDTSTGLDKEAIKHLADLLKIQHQEQQKIKQQQQVTAAAGDREELTKAAAAEAAKIAAAEATRVALETTAQAAPPPAQAPAH